MVKMRPIAPKTTSFKSPGLASNRSGTRPLLVRRNKRLAGAWDLPPVPSGIPHVEDLPLLTSGHPV